MRFRCNVWCFYHSTFIDEVVCSVSGLSSGNAIFICPTHMVPQGTATFSNFPIETLRTRIVVLETSVDLCTKTFVCNNFGVWFRGIGQNHGSVALVPCCAFLQPTICMCLQWLMRLFALSTVGFYFFPFVNYCRRQPAWLIVHLYPSICNLVSQPVRLRNCDQSIQQPTNQLANQPIHQSIFLFQMPMWPAARSWKRIKTHKSPTPAKLEWRGSGWQQPFGNSQ